MADFTFAPQAAIDTTTGLLVADGGLSGSVYGTEADAVAETNPLSVVVAGGVPATSITVSSIGQAPEFTVTDFFEVWWRSGNYIVHLLSFDGLLSDVEDAKTAAQEAEQAAAASAAAAEALADGSASDANWDSISGKPTTFPPSSHSHTRSQISDSTTLGRTLMGASDGQAARAAIGAGTGNGTSNLTLGSTGTTAMPGNRTFADAEITAAANGSLSAGTIRSQLSTLDARGSGSGQAETYLVIWASGAYPTPPGTPPTGVKVRRFYGPVAPSFPTWSGVLDVYEYADL